MPELPLHIKKQIERERVEPLGEEVCPCCGCKMPRIAAKGVECHECSKKSKQEKTK